MTTFSPSISIHVSPKPAADRPPGVFAFVLHDWQLEQFKYKPRSLFSPTDSLGDDKGYPEMCPFNPRIGVKLTERLQWWWFGQLRLSAGVHSAQAGLSAPGMSIAELKNKWRGLTKGFTAFMNNKGTDEYRDYINKANEGADLPQLFENTCGGTTIELFNKSIYAKGYKVKTLKTSDYVIWKGFTFRSHPQYFTKATNATVISYGGKWRVDPMHYLDGADVPVPIISETGYVFIDPARVRVLDANEAFPRSYFP